MDYLMTIANRTAHFPGAILCILLVVGLIGYIVNAIIGGPTVAAQETTYTQHLTFERHTNGLCFAVRRSSQGVSITNIPCRSGDTVFVP